MKSTIILIAIVAASMASATPMNSEAPLFGEQTYVSEWSKFVKTFEKKFVDEAEKLFRFAVFQKNFDFVHNFNRANSGVELAVNEFSDLTRDEFKKMYLGSAPSQTNNEVDMSLLNYADVPTAVDWTTKGAVTPVKNQGQCGSCWAFSTVGSVEGAIAVSTGKLESLSEQQLVDCDYSIFGNKGCNGGLMDTAFKYVMKNGLALEDDYKYTAKKGSCQSSKYAAATSSKISGFKDVPRSNEAALKQAVAQQPVSVAIEADTQVFQFYKSGVLSDAKGCGTQLDHGVLVVGYGTESGKDFWKIKNSWGASWGMNGYILLARTDSTSSVGMCGLATQPSYATVPKSISSSVGVKADFKNCDGSLPVSFSGVDINPAPAKGVETTTTITGKTSVGVSGGSVKITVKLGSLTVLSETDKLCDLVSCPVAAGTIVAKKKLSLPGFSPSGDYTVDVKITDQDGKEVGCVDVFFKLAVAEPQTLLADECPALSSASACDANSACTWCNSAAVKSSCYSKENAKKLPAGVFVCDSSELSFSATNGEVVEQILKGVFAGFAGKDIPDLMPCLGEGTSIVADLKEAVADFETKTVSGIANGLRKIADAIDAVQAAATDCKAATAEVESLVKAIEAFKSPKEFIYHVGKELIVNGKDILAHVEDAVAKYKSADYYSFGSDLGYMIAEVIA